SAAAFCAGYFLAPSPFGTIRRKMLVNANHWRNPAIWLLIAREPIAGNHRHQGRRDRSRQIAREGVASAGGTPNGFPRFPLCDSAMRQATEDHCGNEKGVSFGGAHREGLQSGRNRETLRSERS